MSENKNYFHFFKFILYSGFALFFFITPIFADDVYTTTSIHVLAYDSIMVEIINKLAAIDNLNNTDKELLKWLKAYPEFEYIIRINSKGKIISKVSNNKILPRDFRYVGNQTWYQAVELLEKPYYGNVIQNKGIYLFWNRPVLVKSGKKTKFAGVLSIKINLNKCFNSIAQKNNLNFSILYKKRTIFTNLKDTKSDDTITRKLSIYGFPGLFIQYKKSNPEPVISKVEEKPSVSQPAVSEPVVSQVQEKKTVEKILPVDSRVEEIVHKKSNPSNPVKLSILIYAVAICLFLLGICIFFMNRAVLHINSNRIY